MARRLKQGTALYHRLLHPSELRARATDIPDTMRCVVQKGYGAPEDSLAFARVPTPSLSAFDVSKIDLAGG